MNNNGPISVSAPGTSLMGADAKNITFSTAYPFHKLDSLNPISFQVINLFFSKEPPSPDGSISNYQRTLVYSFRHGYSYVPSSWFLISLNNFQTAFGSEGAYIVGGGGIPQNSSAVFIAEVDSQNVNFYIDKYWVSSSGLGAPSVIGLFVAVRSYIFINDLSGTDVPRNA